MKISEETFFLILIVNILVVLIYLIWKLFRSDNASNSSVQRAVVMLCCPVLGPLYYLVSYVMFKLFMSREVDLEDVVFSKDRVRTTVRAEEEVERNMVSLEEAIAVSEKSDLRALMLNIVKNGAEGYLSTISEALNSMDTETAHYAAAVLQGVLNEFRMRVQNETAGMDPTDPACPQKMRELARYMNTVLEQHVFTEIEQKSYVDKLDEVTQVIYDGDKTRLETDDYKAVIMRLLETESFERARVWCDRQMQEYPSALSAYTCYMKLYYLMDDKDHFFDIMTALRRTDIVVDNETLAIIRTFI